MVLGSSIKHIRKILESDYPITDRILYFRFSVNMAPWHFLRIVVVYQLLLCLVAVCAIASTIKMNDKKEVAVFGHINPDTDSITAALVYADFLCRMKVNAKAYRLGDLNNETKFVLKTARVQQPDMLPEYMPDGSEVALVDHNESELK
jgi:hypothetical protein